MNKIGNFLWKLFSVFALFVYGSNDKAYADDTQTNKIYSTSTSGQRITLCPSGQYVYSCSGVRVGYNWLKNMSFTNPDSTSNVQYVQEVVNGQVVETPIVNEKIYTANYLIGNTYAEKIDQMRAFFSGDTSINKVDCDATGCSDSVETSRNVLDDRDIILGYLCNPFNEKTNIVCAACPEQASVASSSVRYDTYVSPTLLIKRSWNFHTIADCYMTQFEDSTGDFIYIAPGTAVAGIKNGSRCYYTNTAEADQASLAGDVINDKLY